MGVPHIKSMLFSSMNSYCSPFIRFGIVRKIYALIDFEYRDGVDCNERLYTTTISEMFIHLVGDAFPGRMYEEI